GIEVLNGRYGPYITDGEKNAKIPKDRDPKSLTHAECKALIEAAPVRRGRGAFKKAAAKKTAEKQAPAKKAMAKKAAKKSATRKSAAKKAAARKTAAKKKASAKTATPAEPDTPPFDV